MEHPDPIVVAKRIEVIDHLHRLVLLVDANKALIEEREEAAKVQARREDALKAALK